MEPERKRGVHKPVRRLNGTVIALIAGLVLLVLLVAYFASRGNGDQDKLTNAEVSSGTVQNRDKLCASSATYNLIKRELFSRAAQLRGSDRAAYDRLSSVAVVRMENPVMESEDSSTGAVNCSGSLSLDLPPGVAVVGGMLTSTFLTLIVIPVVYTLFSDLTEKLGRKKTLATLPVEPAPVGK